MFNLSAILEDSASKHPQKPAFTFNDVTLNFAQINEAANTFANGLQNIGIKPGDKIALNCLNLPQFPIIYFGILKAGAVVVPLSILLKKDEIAFQLANSDAKVFFCFTGTAELPMGKFGWDAFKETNTCQHFYMIMPLSGMASPIEGTVTTDVLTKDQPTTFETVQTIGDDTAVIIFTSGTTGVPKGAELSHTNLFCNALISIDVLQILSTDTQLLALPMFHIFAMTVQMNAGIYKAIHTILLPRFDAAMAFQLFKKHNVSVFAGVPTMYWALLNHQSDAVQDAEITKHLRMCASGGASLPVKVLHDFEARFKVPVTEGYGMSEGSPIVTFNQHAIGRKPGSIGTAVWGVEVKITDKNGNELPVGEKGELWYRGHNVMKGYYKLPAATAEVLTNGWLHSGDIAVKDTDGFYFIVDRTKDMIIRGGKNVYPREVEDAMMRHEAVSLVAVVGVPHEEMGEEIKAFVVLKKDVVATPEQLISWTKEQIASYKYPRHVQIVEALPMTATGKILKKELRKKSAFA